MLTHLHTGKIVKINPHKVFYSGGNDSQSHIIDSVSGIDTSEKHYPIGTYSHWHCGDTLGTSLRPLGLCGLDRDCCLRGKLVHNVDEIFVTGVIGQESVALPPQKDHSRHGVIMRYGFFVKPFLCHLMIHIVVVGKE